MDQPYWKHVWSMRSTDAPTFCPAKLDSCWNYFKRSSNKYTLPICSFIMNVFIIILPTPKYTAFTHPIQLNNNGHAASTCTHSLNSGGQASSQQHQQQTLLFVSRSLLFPLMIRVLLVCSPRIACVRVRVFDVIGSVVVVMVSIKSKPRTCCSLVELMVWGVDAKQIIIIKSCVECVHERSCTVHSFTWIHAQFDWILIEKLCEQNFDICPPFLHFLFFLSLLFPFRWSDLCELWIFNFHTKPTTGRWIFEGKGKRFGTRDCCRHHTSDTRCVIEEWMFIE